MGSTIANVQVWSDVPREAVGQAVERIEAERYVRAAPEEKPDRTTLIFPGRRWSSVFDELLDGGGPDAVERIAAELSRELRTWALGIRVDDDELRLRLFRDGALVDGLGDHPAPRAQRWKELLAKGCKSSQLAAAFSRKRRFAEGWLEELATLLDLDPRLAALGRSTLAEAAVDPADAVRVPLRRLTQAAPEPRLTSKPSAFELNWPFDGERWPGEQIMLQPFFTSKVPLSRGLRLEVSGSALDSGLIEIADRGSASAQDPGAQTTGAPHPFRLEAASPSGPRVLAAELSASLLPPAGPPKDPAADRVSVQVTLHAVARAPGEGQLVIRLVPEEAPAGVAERLFRYRVVERPPIDLPAGARAGHAPALRRLHAPRVLSLLAILEGGASRLPDYAPLLLRWAGFIHPQGGGTWLAAGKEGAERFEAPAEGLGRSARWLELLAAAMRGARLLCTCLPPEGAPPPLPYGHPRTPRRDGFSASRIARDAFQLGFWARREPFTPEREEAARALLREIAASLAAGGGLLQAAIVRQDWAPTGGAVASAPTPYEEILGSARAEAQPPDLRRQLRQVGEELWLGPAMRALAGRAALERVAQLEEAGDAWSVRLREGRALADLERALEPLLPRTRP
ncbi:MAG TPA: hypothetical protein VI356_09385 [Myxococcales bacterium]